LESDNKLHRKLKCFQLTPFFYIHGFPLAVEGLSRKRFSLYSFFLL